jgi:hypothetical protein
MGTYQTTGRSTKKMPMKAMEKIPGMYGAQLLFMQNYTLCYVEMNLAACSYYYNGLNGS